MSRNDPLACRHCQASQRRTDSLRPALAGVAFDQHTYILDVFRADLPPAIVKPAHLRASMNESFLERKGKMRLYATAFTRRHIGAARTRDTSPAAINSCAS